MAEAMRALVFVVPGGLRWSSARKDIHMLPRFGCRDDQRLFRIMSACSGVTLRSRSDILFEGQSWQDMVDDDCRWVFQEC